MKAAVDLHLFNDDQNIDGLVVSAHISGSKLYPHPLSNGVHAIDVHKYHPVNILHDLIGRYPSFSATRDPLLSIITRQERVPDLKHFYIIDGFLSLVKLIEVHSLLLVPVDLYVRKTVSERLSLLHRMLEVVDLPEEPYVESWAAIWPKYNFSPGDPSRLRQGYDSGDLNIIMEYIPEEYSYLKSKEAVLKPFLQKLGYENLLWWEKD